MQDLRDSGVSLQKVVTAIFRLLLFYIVVKLYRIDNETGGAG